MAGGFKLPPFFIFKNIPNFCSLAFSEVFKGTGESVDVTAKSGSIVEKS